jgi:type VI secretion system protein ImpK
MQERQDTGSDAAFTGASSNNQLVAAANPLLNAIPQIRHSVSMTIRWRYASA